MSVVILPSFYVVTGFEGNGALWV